ncbi:MAG: UPF0280 family protein [Dehalococcoidia bacterium]|nr:MAG: UPF0280 family protein [Dehalococcoidia bacterium]
MYQPHKYRAWAESSDLISFIVNVEETNLFISARTNLVHKAYRLVRKYRNSMERYILDHPEFLTSLKPVEVDKHAPVIVRSMAEAARWAGVGPMAAVAGAIAEFVGTELAKYSTDIIIENGGDLYIRSTTNRNIGIYAGISILSGKISIKIEGHRTPCGICTSSGTVGHSLSFGKADAVTIIALSAVTADATATACANLVHTAEDIPHALELAQRVPGVTGAMVIIGDRLGVWGEVTLKNI